jgi:dGTPase
MNPMYTKADKQRKRKIASSPELEKEPYRHPFRRDISRLMHAPAFRRLQGKTQLFPCQESDFFRNRLTHSLEVAQLAEGIAHRVNFLFKKNGVSAKVSPYICRFASLAHDIGHPPFGHLGEEVLNLKMHGHGGFEGNAQTLRIIARLEQAEMLEPGAAQVGLNLCFRSLSSILKYDSPISLKQTDYSDEYLAGIKALKPKKGFYLSEKELVTEIKNQVAPGHPNKFKTIECAIMDIADDISNAVYDLEDAFRGGFCSPLDILGATESIWENTAKKVRNAMEEQDNYLEKPIDRSTITADIIKEIVVSVIGSYLGLVNTDNDYPRTQIEAAAAAYRNSNFYAKDGAARTSLSSHLIGKFVRGIQVDYNELHPAMSRVYVEDEAKKLIDALKNLTYEFQITSRKLRIVALRGIEIVSTIFDALTGEDGYKLMPECFIKDYLHSQDKTEEMRVICDFVAGMTDRYAVEFYGRLKSENPETIFRPF